MNTKESNASAQAKKPAQATAKLASNLANKAAKTTFFFNSIDLISQGIQEGMGKCNICELISLFY